MGESSQYLMKVDDFDANFVSSFSLLRDSEEFFDVTLVSDDEIPIQAHKVVLSASSPFFRNVLKFQKVTSPLLYIRGVTNNILAGVVEFIYKGEVTVEENNLDSFLKLAEDLKLRGLSENDKVNSDNWSWSSPETMGTKSEKKKKQDRKIKPQEKEKIEDNKDGQVKSKQKPEALVLKEEGNEEEEDEGEDKNALTENEVIGSENQDTELVAKISAKMFKENKLWHCKVCGVSKPKKSNLQVHVEIHHMGVVHPCKSCDYVTKSRQAHFRHIKMLHSIN